MTIAQLSIVSSVIHAEPMSDGIGAFVRRKRIELGYTQTELAQVMGMTRSHLSVIESGKIALPQAAVRRTLAKTLGVSHLDLLIEAGELLPEEIALAGAEGVVQHGEHDPRERQVERLRQLPWRREFEATLDQFLELWEFQAAQESKPTKPQP